MKLIHNLLFTAFILIKSLCSQAQENPLQAYLPADAKTIIHFNLASLASKINWQELQQLDFFKQALNDAPSEMKEILKNPASTGINFQGDFFIVTLADPKNKTKSLPVLYGQLTDTAKFAATIQKTMPKQKIKRFGKIRVLADGKQAIAWTPGLFVVPMSKEKPILPPLAKKGKENGVQSTKTVAAKTKELINQCQLLLTPVSNPLTNDKRFIDLVNETGDMKLWINRNMEKQKPKAKKTDEVLKMMNWSMMQHGDYIAGVMRFENGKAVMQMKSYMNKTMDSLYRLYPAKSLNIDLLKKFPAGQPMALISFNMSMEMIRALMKASGAEKIMDSLTKKSSIKPMEIAEGLNGDLTLAVIKALEVDDKDSVTQALQGIQFFLTASVKNKSKIEPLLTLLQKPKEIKPDSTGNESKPSGPLGGLKPAILLNDSFFVVSISSFAAEKFLNTVGDNEISNLASPYANHASLFSLDLKTILSFAMQMSRKKSDDKEGQEITKMLEALDKIVFYGGKYENGAAMSTAELQFSDKEENSLKQLIKLIETLVKQGKKDKKPKTPPGEDASPDN